MRCNPQALMTQVPPPSKSRQTSRRCSFTSWSYTLFQSRYDSSTILVVTSALLGAQQSSRVCNVWSTQETLQNVSVRRSHVSAWIRATAARHLGGLTPPQTLQPASA